MTLRAAAPRGPPGGNASVPGGPNTSGGGDNRNVRGLGARQGATIRDGGTATFQSAYAALVSFVGNKSREADVNGKASAALLAQATQSQQNVSGVNLDEEAARLIQFQQSYQAAAKMLQVAQTVFDTLLQIGK